MSHCICVRFVLYALSKLWTVTYLRFESGCAASSEVAGVSWGAASPDTHVSVLALLELMWRFFLPLSWDPFTCPSNPPLANPAQTPPSLPPSLPSLGLIWYVQWCDKTKREVFDCTNTPFGGIPAREESIKESDSSVGRPRCQDWRKCKLQRKK